MTPAHDDYRRFLRLFTLGLALGLGAIAALTILVDPYQAFGWVRIDGVNAYKIDVGNDRLVKANVMARAKYDGLILGTSQAQFGIDPDSPALSTLAERFYNAGLLSATPYQMLRYLQHGASVNRIKAAVVMVDLLMFTKHPVPAMLAAFSERRLSVSRDGKPQSRWLDPDFVTQVLSFDALRKTVATVRKQAPMHEILLDNGLRSPAFLERQITEKGGTRAAFHDSEHAYLTSYGHFELFGPDRTSRALEDFDALLHYARKENFRVIVLFPPAHARQLEVLRVSGHLDRI